ncbi:LuxR C-terminal-related transcriptional regulator [Winogradskyella maritima]|uniref:Response regulator transcription factor n=1 Tax=Winogradskyella maritima TaxID=1517766 RepID=A0ABV8AJ64_9FLAO|nr:LuxR C-terminal-related transcriptional regulator [Winogradskyella maritima]
MRVINILVLLFLGVSANAQFSFSGQINPDKWQNTVYLSVVEDYRKLNGIYAEQIIAKTEADSDGFFEFKGNMLNTKNRIYRIHIDNCSAYTQDANHFNGHCEDSKELLFIANNTDTITFPYSFDQQVFCDINSSNETSNALLRVDSLKADMRFAYGSVRSEANRKLNNQKWFTTLKDFGASLEEPLADLYIYSFLSDRRNDFHNYYINDLQESEYYSNLLDKLETNYEDTSYLTQYKAELTADEYVLNPEEASSTSKIPIWVYVLLGVSLLFNLFLAFRAVSKKKKTIQDLRDQLSKQERIVLDHLLQDKSNKDIAEALFLSVSTVKTHTNNIYKKLNVQSRDETKSLFSK